jgi:hypothetical protein
MSEFAIETPGSVIVHQRCCEQIVIKAHVDADAFDHDAGVPLPMLEIDPLEASGGT